jgi:DNA repair protein RadC
MADRKTTDPTRLKKLNEVLGLISSRDDFRKREIQFLCSESKPAFVTTVLKQLTAEGYLISMLADKEEHFRWAETREKFSPSDWISGQILGSQVTSIPSEERPRERLLDLGPQSLKTSELFAILIRSGVKGESAVQGGQKLSNHFNAQLEKICDQSHSDLRKLSKSISQAAFCQIMAGIELGRRVAEDAGKHRPKEKINSTQAAKAFCQRHFARLANDAKQEEFHIVTLDTKLQPIQSHQITIGTLDASLVHPREVFRAALRDAASAILLIHNHPSGDPTPSRQDREVTERLKKSGELLGINVIDHIIVARDDTVSLAESG